MDDYNKNYKLSILNEMINTADDYKRKKESLDIHTYEKDKIKYIEENNKIKKNIKISKYFISAVSIIFAISINTLILYIYALVGKNTFIKFINNYAIELVIAPIFTAIIIWIVNRFTNI